MQDLKKEVIFITGASSGLGRALTLEAAERGAKLIIVARNAERLAEVKAEAEKLGATVHGYLFDLHELEGISGLYQRIKAETELVPTLLINNAGYNAPGFVLTTPTEVYENNFKTNVFAPIELIQSIVPDMISQGKGGIVTLVSAAMFTSFPGISSYCSTKKAIGAIHESLEIELEGTPIRTLYVNPGSFKSNYFINARKITDERLGQFVYQTKNEGLRKDPRFVAKSIYDALLRGERKINLCNFKDRIGVHIGYWAPSLLKKILLRNNQGLLNARHFNLSGENQ